MMSCVTTPEVCGRSSTGQIQVIFGPMFSGKTTELMRRMKRYQIANYECLIIKYANDVRYDKENLATHDKQSMAAKSTTNLKSLMSEALEYDVLGVDEGQFFPDVVEFCELMANHGKAVIVAALDGTYQREGFGDILKLVPMAESVMKLTAVCMMCFGEAAFTKRIGQEKEVEVIGGADKYLAVCRSCYKKPPKTGCSPRPQREKSLKTVQKENFTQARRLFGTAVDQNAVMECS